MLTINYKTITMKQQPYLVFDGETSPLDLEELEALAPPFEAAANLKDPAKILASIAEKKQKWIDDAALSAQSGKVLCIAISENGNRGVIDGDESAILSEFWSHLDSMKTEYAGAALFIGFNSNSFDVPFFVRRSWILGVPVPGWIRPNKYLNDCFVDLLDKWKMGDREAKTGGLNTLAKCFKVGEKNGSGKLFYKLWGEDREAALAYALQDIALTEAIAMKMGVIQPISQESVIHSDETDDFDY